MAPPAKKRKTANSATGASSLAEEMRLRKLEEENAELRERLAAVEAPTATVKYTYEGQKDFLKQMNQAKSIDMLDLTELKRMSSSFIGNWYPKWKPCKKLDIVTSSILAATDDVKALDLGDGEWAGEDKYAQDLASMLRKYKATLREIRVAKSTLIDRHETVASLNKKGRQSRHAQIKISKCNIMGLVAGLPKLTTLKLTLDTSHGENSEYNGEFNAAAKKKLFSKVNQLEVFLTPRWIEWHVGGEVVNCDMDAANTSNDEDEGPSCSKRWRRETQEDQMASDLLKYYKHVISHFDMADFPKTKTDPPILGLISGLTALRSVVLRAEMLPAVSGLPQLQTIELHVSGRLSREIVESLVELFATKGPLQNIKHLDIKVKQARIEDHVSALLGAVAGHCRRLEVLKLTASGWREADVTALLEGGAPLRELHLSRCGAVLPAHLPLVAALPKLVTLRLPSRLLGKPGADAVADRRGLDLRWEF